MMNLKKRIISLLLSAMLLFALLTGCAAPAKVETPAPTPAVEVPAEFQGNAQATAPSTVQVSAPGYKGDIVLAVSAQDGKLSDIAVVSHGETTGIGSVALDTLLPEILEYQSLNVDGVSGATLTSSAILLAVADAAEQLGLSAEALQNAPAGESKSAVEDLSTDIVVVGAGVAGMMSAIQLASKSPNEVLLLEVAPMVGGSALRSGGVIWAVNSPVYRNLNHPGLPYEKLVGFFNKHSEGKLNLPLIKKIIASSTGTVDELMAYGLPLNMESLMSTDPRQPWLRSMTTVGSGAKMVEVLAAQLDKYGVTLITQARAKALVADESGVHGVIAQKDGQEFQVNAKKVVLATGGFSQSPEMMEKYLPKYATNIMLTAPNALGDGLAMVEQFQSPMIGEGIIGSNRIDPALGRSLETVATFNFNQEGKRFVDELRFYAEKHEIICSQPGAISYAIMDSSYEKPEDLKKLVDGGYAIKADTIEEIAAYYKVDAATLVSEVAAYNALRKAGTGKDAFDASIEKMLPLETAPYYAFKINPCALGTIRGVAVDEDGRVLSGDRQPVQNLFAVGELAMGNYFSFSYPVSGTGLSVSLYAGKVAAEAVMAELIAERE